MTEGVRPAAYHGIWQYAEPCDDNSVSGLTAQATDTQLRVSGLAAGYGGSTVFSDVSFDVSAGEMVAVLGRNGAGKTTLLNCISGLVPPRAGGVSTERDLAGMDPRGRVRHGIAQVPEGRRMVPGLTVWENLQLGSFALPRRQFPTRLERVLEYFPSLRSRLQSDACSLSGGQQQLVAVARALMSAPRFLLLDEPLTGLAPATAWDVLEVLSQLRNQGQAVLIVEQNAELALEFADTTFVLGEGHLRRVDMNSEHTTAEIIRGYFG